MPDERKHFAIASYLVSATWQGGNHQHGAEQGYHHRRYRSRCAVPGYGSLKDEHYESYQGTHHYHRMQADEAALEEFSQRQCLSPTVIIGVADDETGKNEEEVNRQIAVVDLLDDG